jgi:hypothetical protein
MSSEAKTAGCPLSFIFEFEKVQYSLGKSKVPEGRGPKRGESAQGEVRVKLVASVSGPKFLTFREEGFSWFLLQAEAAIVVPILFGFLLTFVRLMFPIIVFTRMLQLE